MAFNERLKQLSLELKKEYQEIAHDLGLSKSQLSQYVTGKRKVPSELLQQIVDVYHINPRFLFKEGEPLYLISTQADTNIMNTEGSFYTVKVYGKIAAGEPIEMIEDVDEINCPWATNSEDLFALQVKGDSMNKVILDGHYAVLEKCEEPVTGKIYAVIVDNENATLKRLHILDGGVMLEPLSTNPEHKRKTYEGEETDIRVIGRYIGCVSPYQN